MEPEEVRVSTLRHLHVREHAMTTIQEHDDKVVAEWTRIFRLSRAQDFGVVQSMKNAALFIEEEYDIVHPDMIDKGG